MAAGISRPDVWTGIALNADPNDPYAPPVWTPLESDDFQLLKVGQQVAGRDYELAQSMSSSPVVTVRDVNEYLNSDNEDSPYAGDVECYRHVAQVCQWPIAASGGAVNLINSGTWRPADIDPYDPTFESYATGADGVPNWISQRFLEAFPTISTSNPFQGAQSLQVPMTTLGAGQGVSWPITCIPGRTYTSSAYVRQTAGNSLGIFLHGITAAYDVFRRTVASGLGTPGASWGGISYTTAGGAAGDYAVSSGRAVLTVTAANTTRMGLLAGSFFDSEQTITVTAPAIATGAAYAEGLTARYIDDSNHYRANVVFETDSSISLSIERRVAGVSTLLVDTEMPLPYAAGQKFVLYFRVDADVLSAHLWPLSRPESLIYAESVVDSTAALQAPGAIGFVGQRTTGNTNSNLATAFESYAATASIRGDTTTATGSYQRLDITFTADQLGRPAAVDISSMGRAPRGLSISIETYGASTVASTVNIDAIQHEQSGTASAFTADGPVIYPLFRLLAERYPRGWRSKGFEGVCAMPCVDALAALNKIDISDDYEQAVRAFQPDLLYALSGSGSSISAPDTSGNAGPTLVPIVSPIGAGTAPSSGTQMGLPGAPSITGTEFTWTGPADLFRQQGTILGAGPGTANPAAIALPVVTHGRWAMTIACWVRLTDTAETTPVVVGATRLADTNPLTEYRPIQLSANGVSLRNGSAAPGLNFPAASQDGQLHFLLGQVVQDATNTTFRARIDGQTDETTVSTAVTCGGFFPAGRADTLTIGGTYYPIISGVSHTLNGAVGPVAIWHRELSSAERDSLWEAGSASLLLQDGELAGDRIFRHIEAGQYTGATRIGRGSSLLGPSSIDGAVDLLTDSLSNALADQGVLWTQPDGLIAFEGRQARWLRLDSEYTFGEDFGGGEIPYQDGILFTRDPTYVFPNVTWDRFQGASAVGGLPVDRQRAFRRFFPRAFSARSDFLTDNQAQDAANWTFYSHRAPMTRVESLAVDPWANPALWPAVLSMEPGKRVTVVRRAKAANGGAGLVIAREFFVEKRTVEEMSFAAGSESWFYVFQLSPIDPDGAPDNPTMQPWLLGDATYGVLNQTTVLGW